jgi:flagellum-specific peptidoglycan hydrolase FlgJ
MPPITVPSKVWQGFQADQLQDQTVGLLDGLKQQLADATRPVVDILPKETPSAPSMPSLPSLDDLTKSWGGQDATTTTPGQPASSGFALPSLDDLTSAWQPSRASTTTPPGQVAATFQDGRQEPQPRLRPGESVGSVTMTSGSRSPAPMQGPVDSQTAIDNSSRESFIRTAYPHALEAANGDRALANQLIATAISENGKVGTGRDLGEMGFNVGGIQGVKGTAGSFTALDAGRPREFAAYNNLSEGFRAVRDLVSGGRYAQAAENYRQTGDIDRYWREVNQAGYSETPDWQDRIASIRRTQVEPLTSDAPTAAPARPTAPSGQPVAMPTLSAPAQAATRTAGRYARNQGEVGAELGLPWQRTVEICGPVAAAAFLRKTGRLPGQEEAEAMRVAREKGYWQAGRGMGGTASEENLLNDLGVATKRVEGAPDWNAVAADVQRGNPVIIDAGDHYMVAEDYDPQTGAFDFGETAGFLRNARGRTTFRPDELPSLSGPGMTISPTAAIYLDNPTTPAPSVVAGRSESAPDTLRSSLDAGQGDTMQRQPLQPTDPEASTGDYANPDDGPRESGYSMPPTAYGASGDDPGQTPLPSTDYQYSTGGEPIGQAPSYEMPTRPRVPQPIDATITNGGEPLTSDGFQEVQTRPLAARAENDNQGPVFAEQSMPDGLTPIYNRARQIVGWLQDEASNAVSQIGQNMAGNRQAVQDANAGQSGGVDFGAGATNAVQDIGQTVATEGIATPIARAISNPIREAIGKPPLPDMGQPETTIDRAIVETGRSLGRNVDAMQSGLTSGDYGEAGMGALGIVGDLAPSTTLARQLNEMVPHGNFPVVGEVGLGDAIMTAALVRDAARLGYGAIKVGGSTLASIARAVQEGVPAERFGQWLSQNGERVAAADARMAAEGSTAAPGALGQIPEQFGQPYPPIKGRIGDYQQNALGEASAEMVRDSRMPRDAVHPDIRAAGIGPEITPQVDTSSRLNAGAGTVPVDVPVDRLGAVNRVLGQGVASAVSGGVGAQVNQEMNPDDPYAAAKGFAVGALAPLAAARGAGALARRLGRETELGSAARIGLGDVPPSKLREPVLPGFEPPYRKPSIPDVSDTPNRPPVLGDVPPSAIREPMLPGMEPAAANLPPVEQFEIPTFTPGQDRRVQTAVQRAQQEATPGLSPLQWVRRLVGEAGYSSMIGPATFTVNLTGNVAEPLYAIPKETARGVARAVQTGNASALREPGEMAAGAFHGLSQVGTAMLDALMARGRYAPTPGHEPLSMVTQNPIGKGITTILEGGGRVFSAIPDAIFGTIAQGAGEARTAAQIATDAGLKGTAWKQHVNDLLSDAANVRAGQLPTLSATQRVLDEGAAYAKRQTFQDELGEYGRKARTVARLGDLPVVGNLVTPFFNTPWNMTQRMAERTPIGFAMNSQGSKFDKMYDATLGSALLAGIAAGPVASGAITGGGPDDPQKKAEMRSQGWRPYSTLIDGVYVPNRVFGIYAPLLNAAADVHDAIAYSKDKTPGSIASNYVGRLGQQLQQQPYLQGLSNVMQAIQAGQGGGLGAAAERYASSTITRMVPYGATARTIGTAMDPYERTTDRGKNTPSETTIASRSRAGSGRAATSPLLRMCSGGPRRTSNRVARTSQERRDPVIQAFLDANVDIPIPPAKAGDYIMTTDEKRAWNAARGQYVMQHIPPTLGTLTSPRRQERLRDLLEMANEYADRAVERTIPLNQRSQRRREAEAAAKAS